MNVVLRFIPVVPLLALALAASGCGSSSPTDASSVAGATIRGSVNSNASASASDVSALSSGSGKVVRVMVVGMPIETTTDSSGNFVLQGLPAGDVTLHFKGSGMDAMLRIGGLVEGQVLTIAVQVNGSRATLVSQGNGGDDDDDGDDDDNDDDEFTGRIDSITPPSLRVAGRTVITNGSTRIERDDRRIALTDLRVGERVEVEGMTQADGSILAREIEADDNDD